MAKRKNPFLREGDFLINAMKENFRKAARGEIPVKVSTPRDPAQFIEDVREFLKAEDFTAEEVQRVIDQLSSSK